MKYNLEINVKENKSKNVNPSNIVSTTNKKMCQIINIKKK